MGRTVVLRSADPGARLVQARRARHRARGRPDRRAAQPRTRPDRGRPAPGRRRPHPARVPLRTGGAGDMPLRQHPGSRLHRRPPRPPGGGRGHVGPRLQVRPPAGRGPGPPGPGAGATPAPRPFLAQPPGPRPRGCRTRPPPLTGVGRVPGRLGPEFGRYWCMPWGWRMLRGLAPPIALAVAGGAGLVACGTSKYHYVTTKSPTLVYKIPVGKRTLRRAVEAADSYYK